MSDSVGVRDKDKRVQTEYRGIRRRQKIPTKLRGTEKGFFTESRGVRENIFC